MEMLGFIGLGLMGQPMALNLARAPHPLMVWNRSPQRCRPLLTAGASRAETVAELFASCRVVILMLADDRAIDAVLARGTSEFRRLVSGRTIVHMGTTAPGFSVALEGEVIACGGRYVEAPVSGSRVPAESGELVAMLASRPGVAEEIAPLLAPMCRETFLCGPAPSGLLMKLAVNLYLITMVTGLAESVHFARRHRLDLEQLERVLEAGPMSSSVSRIKVAKLVTEDFAPQAAVADVLQNNRLVASAARAAHIASPLIDICHELYAEAQRLGHGALDMAAVVRALEARTESARGHQPECVSPSSSTGPPTSDASSGSSSSMPKASPSPSASSAVSPPSPA